MNPIQDMAHWGLSQTELFYTRMKLNFGLHNQANGVGFGKDILHQKYQYYNNLIGTTISTKQSKKAVLITVNHLEANYQHF